MKFPTVTPYSTLKYNGINLPDKTYQVLLPLTFVWVPHHSKHRPWRVSATF